MRVRNIKAGRTYVARNGLQRRLEKIEIRNGDKLACYTPIDRKGNEGEIRWSSIEGFASSVLGVAVI